MDLRAVYATDMEDEVNRERNTSFVNRVEWSLGNMCGSYSYLIALFLITFIEVRGDSKNIIQLHIHTASHFYLTALLPERILD